MDRIAKYQIIDTVGQGNFGIVKLVQCDDDGQFYVIKQVHLRGMTPDAQEGAKREVRDALCHQLQRNCLFLPSSMVVFCCLG